MPSASTTRSVDARPTRRRARIQSGEHHAAAIATSFRYGHPPLSTAMSAERGYTPAAHMSVTEFASVNSKMGGASARTVPASSAAVADSRTSAPAAAFDETNNATFPSTASGSARLTHRGTLGETAGGAESSSSSSIPSSSSDSPSGGTKSEPPSSLRYAEGSNSRSTRSASRSASSSSYASHSGTTLRGTGSPAASSSRRRASSFAAFAFAVRIAASRAAAASAAARALALANFLPPPAPLLPPRVARAHAVPAAPPRPSSSLLSVTPILASRALRSVSTATASAPNKHTAATVPATSETRRAPPPGEVAASARGEVHVAPFAVSSAAAARLFTASRPGPPAAADAAAKRVSLYTSVSSDAISPATA